MPCPSLFTILSGIRRTLGGFLACLRIEGSTDLSRALGVELCELGLDFGVALDVAGTHGALRLGGLLLALEGRADLSGLLGIEVLESAARVARFALAGRFNIGSLCRFCLRTPP